MNTITFPTRKNLHKLKTLPIKQIEAFHQYIQFNIIYKKANKDFRIEVLVKFHQNQDYQSLTIRQHSKIHKYHLNTHSHRPSHQPPKKLMMVPPNFIKLQAQNNIKIKSILSMKLKKGLVSQSPHLEETLLEILVKTFNPN